MDKQADGVIEQMFSSYNKEKNGDNIQNNTDCLTDEQ